MVILMNLFSVEKICWDLWIDFKTRISRFLEKVVENEKQFRETNEAKKIIKKESNHFDEVI